MPGFAADDSRRLLARLRSVMSGKGSAQLKLDKTARIIAEGMKVDVCSCYVLRAGEVLELFTTHGLDPNAVHVTRLRVGEGLVGEIVSQKRPLALADAWSHPQFVYRPETGEDFFRSFMGVPLVQASRIVGVLAVQNKEERDFDDWQVDTLETVAMVISELLAATELVKRSEVVPVQGNAVLAQRMAGLALHGGIGIGIAVMHAAEVRIGRLFSDNADAEKARLHAALADLKSDIDHLIKASEVRDSGAATDLADVIEAYSMIAADGGLIRKIETGIDGGLTAEAATQKMHEDMRRRMQQIGNPLIRERVLDLDDMVRRLLRVLTGSEQETDIPDDAILVARSLGPAELLSYDATKLKGLILEEGSPTMHAVVIARALDIPVVGQVKDVINRVDALDSLIVDGESGQVILRPVSELQELYAENASALAQQKRQYANEIDLPARTLDGVDVALLLNAGLEVDVPVLNSTGAEGVGLFRTELSFLSATTLPTVVEQEAFYRRILDGAGDKPVTFRTLDVGGDKVLPYWQSLGAEENPAMGWRAIRIGLDHPSLLRGQLRALFGAGEGRELRILFPMVTSIAELVAVKDILSKEFSRCRGKGLRGPSDLKVGVMIEVPALLWQLEDLIKAVDFLCVGTNDLLQFVFAADRSNSRLQDRYDVLSQPSLKLLKSIADAANNADIEVTVCGEMAGRPLEALALLGLGFRRLSMAAASIGRVKRMVRSIDVGQVAPLIHEVYNDPSRSLRPKLRSFAIDNRIMLA
ncbi:MAG: phosphoenolpyruvate--protein phosphotransferase [Rhodospirillaceae bacterium]